MVHIDSVSKYNFNKNRFKEFSREITKIMIHLFYLIYFNFELLELHHLKLHMPTA